MYGKNYKNCFILCKSINLHKMSDTLVSHAEDIPINMSNFDDLFQLNNKVSWEESFKYIVVPDEYYFIKFYQKGIELQNQEAWRKKNEEILMNLYKK